MVVVDFAFAKAIYLKSLREFKLSESQFKQLNNRVVSF
ncbi:hypothetical protein NMS_0885 [Nonlabens marinus S1-08]|uniref:Uncharacterized protein n=1 Tax=Nonlabens marinus S1-08 TaxID=1454201 RepID=W8VP84_9FLAO|nr:hypothetical protein NMS_0885 [Nonlabens marinus S1-08]